MTDLRHAPTAPEAAVRPPDPAVDDLEPDLSDLRPEVSARAGHVGGRRHGRVPGGEPGRRNAGEPGRRSRHRRGGSSPGRGNRDARWPRPAAIDALHASRPPQTPAAAAQRLVVQRDGPQQATPNFVIPIEPGKTKWDLTSETSYVRGSVAFKGEIKGELVRKGQDSAAVGAGGTSNLGGQTEITLAQQKGFAIFAGLEVEKVKETLAFGLSKKKLDVSLAAAIAMGYGVWQGMKNARATRDAAGCGVIARKKAEECAKGFARTLTGSSPGSDESWAEAEAQIQAAMASTSAPREMVVAAATQEQGGHSAIYEKNLKRIKDKLYAEGCAKYDEQSKPDWGFIEEIGPEWGMRGVFRNTFRIVLLGDG